MKILTVLVWFVLGMNVLHAQERILKFISDITVNSDSSLNVQETITILAEGNQIRHGIMREIPTQYKDRFGNAFTIKFTFLGATLNGTPVPTKQVNQYNGVVTYVGDSTRLLRPGVYTYTFTYTSTRQLGFFKDYDELYFNVTGNGWRLPIDYAQANVTLPSTIPTEKLQFDGYTGGFGQQGKEFTVALEQGKVVFRTTRPLKVREGLTLVVAWPKGYIKPPSLTSQLYDFLMDNKSVWVLLLCLGSILYFYIRSWVTVRRNNKPGTIIPLFTPPEGITASQARYLTKMGYDAQALSSEIVNLAVHGYLTIKYEPTFFAGTYKLIKTDKPLDDIAPIQRVIMEKLFGTTRKEIELSKASFSVMVPLVDSVQSALDSTVKTENFKSETDVIASCFLMSLAGAMIALFWSMDTMGAAVIGLLILLVLINIFFAFNLTSYTKAGRQLMDRLEGFKMFLSATELERMKVIGTPPTKTPELYEKYLPYAMAFGVEEAWSKQFTPVFNQMLEQGHPYTPMWYYGGRFSTFNAATFSSSLSSSINSSIASSSQAPGSSSGLGGRGSSGGGSGGGGGGGW